jgi:AraC-like DNA-binding protein/mannose-6-phosphate isomerase-like protein (cupin superfamily)
MRIDYTVEPVWITKIIDVTHKGKRRNFPGSLHAHKPDIYEIIYVDYGKLNLKFSGTEIMVNPGECIFIPPALEHSLIGKDGVSFDYLNVMFKGKMPESLLLRNLPVNRRCLELMEKLKQESIQAMPYFREAVFAILTELIACFLRQVEFSVPSQLPESSTPHRYQSEIVNRAMAYIAERYSKNLNLKDLSKSLGVSKSHLCAIIKKETGESFCTILHKQRITAAKHLLSEGTFSVENISNAVGYPYTSFFFKIFKRITGMTPKAFAKSLGEPTVKE